MTIESISQRYRAEIARLDAEHAELERTWSRVPWYALGAVLAPVAGFMWGWGAAVVDLLVTAALIATSAYLTSVRQTENRWTRERLDHDLTERVQELRMVVPKPSARSELRIGAAS